MTHADTRISFRFDRATTRPPGGLARYARGRTLSPTPRGCGSAERSAFVRGREGEAVNGETRQGEADADADAEKQGSARFDLVFFLAASVPACLACLEG